MKSFLLGLALVLAASSSAFAQSAPCDLAFPTSDTVPAGQSVTLGVCSASKDVSGNPAVILGWALYDNGVRTTPTFTPDTIVSSTGFRQYTTTVPAPSTGVHTYTVASIDATGEGPVTVVPFVLTVSPVVGVPAAPIKLHRIP